MFTTGEFTKIARVSRRLLRHYREIGLFLPQRSEPQSGYHYYSVSQLPRLNRILALRDLGFTLEQIRRTIGSDVSLDELRGMLQMRKAEIEQTLNDEIQRLRSVESRLQMLDQSRPNLEVVIKPIPEQAIISSHYICNSIEHSFQLIHQTHHHLPAVIGQKNLNEMITMLHSEDFKIEGANVEIGYLLANPKQVSEVEIQGLAFAPNTLPAVETMVTTVVTESPDFWQVGTAAIGEWIETHQYRIIGPQREIWHTYPNNPQEYPMIELQIPVEKQPLSDHYQLNA